MTEHLKKLFIRLLDSKDIGSIDLLLMGGFDCNFDDGIIFLELIKVLDRYETDLVKLLHVLNKNGVIFNGPHFDNFVYKLVKSLNITFDNNSISEALLYIFSSDPFIQITEETYRETQKYFIKKYDYIKYTIENLYHTNNERKYLPGGREYRLAQEKFYKGVAEMEG